MNTRNEAIHAFLSEGLQAARADGIPQEAHDCYCACYLAGRLADEKVLQIEAPEQLSRWIGHNKDLFYQAMSDLDPEEIAARISRPAELGFYLLTVLQAEMIYQEPADAAPDHAKVDDDRQRIRDYKLDEIGVC